MNSDTNHRKEFQGNPESAEGPEPNRDEQLLVAYLDGELSEHEIAEIETRLAKDQQLQSHLHALQKTWDMLDELPESQASGQFVKSTIEMLVTRADTTRRKWHRWPLRIVLLTGTFGLAMFAATQLVQNIQTRPYRQFVKDIDFIEKIDVLNDVENIKFLEELHEEGIFSRALIDEEITDVSQ